MQIDVSIIMPVYNAELFISQTIESIIEQTFKNFELIIINDGSIDNSLSICQMYALKDERIKIFNTINQGICKARNLGLKKAIGKYICFCDHDDLYNKYLLEDNITMLKMHNADWIKFSKKEYILKENKILASKNTNFEFKIFNNVNKYDSFYYLFNNDILTFVWDSIFLRDIITQNELEFDTNFVVGGEDIDFCLRYLAYCNKLIINPKTYYYHYARLGISTSSKFSQKKVDTCIYLGKKINEYLENKDIDSSEYNYNYAITRMVLNPICRCLNSASSQLTFSNKINIMNKAINQSFSKSFMFISQEKIGNSKKIIFYKDLFVKNMTKTILLVDLMIMKFINFERFLRTKIIKN